MNIPHITMTDIVNLACVLLYCLITSITISNNEGILNIYNKGIILNGRAAKYIVDNRNNNLKIVL